MQVAQLSIMNEEATGGVEVTHSTPPQAMKGLSGQIRGGPPSPQEARFLTYRTRQNQLTTGGDNGPAAGAMQALLTLVATLLRATHKGGTVVGCAGLINRGHGLKHQPSTGGKETLLCTNDGGGRADMARRWAGPFIHSVFDKSHFYAEVSED
ncbi:unnamed protein product [Symbiodinium necroappetens]|uniref:Uncharacterized protein n=1 Tax=Symbiodinium necroappetens TaxID=1628268 RepID=A0A812JW38_9DINO|nr:unnamed protein product [Symbiodinium necroappetens]